MRMDRELSNISIIDDYHKELKNELQQRESISFNTFLTKVINDKRTSSMLFLEKKDQFTYVIDKLLSSFKKDHNIEYQEYWLITNKQQDAKYYKNKFLTEIKDPSSIVEWKIITILDVPAFKAFLSFLNLYLISHKCPTLIVIDDLSVFRKMSEGTKAVFELINLIVLSVSQLSIESKSFSNVLILEKSLLHSHLLKEILKDYDQTNLTHQTIYAKAKNYLSETKLIYNQMLDHFFYAPSILNNTNDTTTIDMVQDNEIKIHELDEDLKQLL